jgi:hypothetical protein
MKVMLNTEAATSTNLAIYTPSFRHNSKLYIKLPKLFQASTTRPQKPTTAVVHVGTALRECTALRE